MLKPLEVSGNTTKLTASDAVRIKDLDQEIKLLEGFIGVPTFDFGLIGASAEAAWFESR